MRGTDLKPRIERFNAAERVAHWMVAICFLYSAFSGLSLWSHRFYWMAAVLGGGETVRAWHPIGGAMFAAALGVLFVKWARQMVLDRDDLAWLAVGHRYAMHEEEGVPESGRFNAGQKVLFWVQTAGALMLLVSGVVLWFPQAMPRALRLAAVFVHPLAAVVSLGAIIVHIYMSTLVVPGALRAMTKGWVRPGWAKAHHGKWYREVAGK
ncbi:MAG: formate dehydrogenase subunit gamma [Bryobacteraceae bacterium]|nr:formate dehydrogenase subunit gamma [Bryobacteraceae bacterium]MDW8377101.1 formate dehydrogenase subunit gamma [Bryobacterales bacterium]